MRIFNNLFRAVLISLTILVFSVYSLSTAAVALTPEQRNLHAAGINWFELEPVSNVTICGTGEGYTTLVGNDNVERAFNYFLQKGLSQDQSAGIVGNLYYESAVDPTRKQGGGYQTISSPSEIVPNVGYGIAQWTSSSRQEAWLEYAAENNADPLSLALQLDFLWHELETHSNWGLPEIIGSETIRQATWMFMAFFERPASVVDHGYAFSESLPTTEPTRSALDERVRLAESTLSAFGGDNLADLSQTACSLNTAEPGFSASGVRVDSSPPWDNGANCTGTFTEGASVLREFILSIWQPPVTSIGGYDCRPIVGSSSQTSIHGMGRALDIMISALDPETRAIGDQIRNWLINNSVELGLQRVIWNRMTWSSNQDGWREYCGGGCTDEGGSRHPHMDHLHIEINEDGANMLTTFYQGR